MKYTPKSARTFAAALITFGSITGGVDAALVITVSETGGNVVANSVGSLNTTALTDTFGGSGSGMVPSTGYLVTGSNDADDLRGYQTVTGPVTFGTRVTFAGTSSASGDTIGVFGGRLTGGGQISAGSIIVPDDYVSGSQLSGTATWVLQSFDSLGLDEGSYTWTWGSGATADSLTLNIGAVPEPSSALLLGLGALGLAGIRRRT
jgi:hypothetical protein